MMTINLNQLPSKTYRGFRLSNTNKPGPKDTADEAVVNVASGSGTRRLPMSARGREKSPDGFNWGYGGSGPSALAHSILTDLTGDSDFADSHFQTFKSEFIATLPQGEPWTISSEQIVSWLKVRIRVP